MPFPTDGRNHHDAIKVERTMSKFQKPYEEYYRKNIEKFIHVGGTKTTVDFKILFVDNSEVTKSLKEKRLISRGSFDYINSSEFPTDLIPKSIAIYDQWRGINNSSKKNLLIESISDDLVNFPKEFLTNFFKDKVIKKYEKLDGLDVVETSTNKLFINVVPTFFEVLKNGGYLKVQDNGKKQMSYKLDLYDSNHNLLPETGLRIRLHLNNGWTKWYNGKTSVLVLKLQQDKVSKMLQK